MRVVSPTSMVASAAAAPSAGGGAEPVGGPSVFVASAGGGFADPVVSSRLPWQESKTTAAATAASLNHLGFFLKSKLPKLTRAPNNRFYSSRPRRQSARPGLWTQTNVLCGIGIQTLYGLGTETY